MKTFISLGAVCLLLSINNQSQAISLTHKGKTGFVDDIVKGLAELDKKEEQETKAGQKQEVVEQKTEEKTEKKETKKDEVKKETKKEEKKESKKEEKDDSIPMDYEAIKAYSGVIADAAEDSEPERPVVYTQQSGDINQAPRAEHAPSNH